MLPQALKNPSFRKAFFGASLGTMLEYYDYALFPIFMPLFAPLFFPADNIYESISKSYLLMLIPYFARPIGGLFFGQIGDLLGRRKALIASMYGIALATLLVGLTPSCHLLGFGATLILLLAKTIQAFCFGGEYNGAGIYVVEHAQNKDEGLIGALLAAITLSGSLLATLFGIFITSSFMPEWSWRLAFIFGGLIGLAGIRYRKNLLESPHFSQTAAKAYPLSHLIKNQRAELIAGIFIGGFATIPFTTVLVFILPILLSQGKITSHQLMLIHAFLVSVAILTVIIAGYLADRSSPAKAMKFASLLLVLLAYPLMQLINQGNLALIICASALFLIVDELLLGPCHAYLKSIFSLHYRYRGASLSFCLGMSVFGGLTPVIENALYRWTGGFSAIALWLIVMGLGTFLAIHFAGKRKSLDRLAIELEAGSVWTR